MATRIITSNTANGYNAKLNLTLVSQNPEANESEFTWSMQINCISNYFNAPINGTVTIAGDVVWSRTDMAFNSGGKSGGHLATVAGGMVTIKHDSDGRKTITVGIGLQTVNQTASWRVPPLSITSFPYVIDPIPREPLQPPTPPTFRMQTNRILMIQASVPRAASPVTGHHILVRKIVGSTVGAWEQFNTDANRERSYDAGNAPVKIEARSRAFNVHGNGEWSTISSLVVEYKPLPLGNPTVTENSSTRRITIVAPVANTKGSTVLGYQIRIRDNYNNTGWVIHNVPLGTRSHIFTPTTPTTTFDVQARAQTVAGWSDWPATHVTHVGLGSGPKVLHSGVWKSTNAFVRHNGSWRPAMPYVKVSLAWKPVRRQ